MCVIGSCQLPDVGAGTWIQILCKNSMCSCSLSLQLLLISFLNWTAVIFRVDIDTGHVYVYM